MTGHDRGRPGERAAPHVEDDDQATLRRRADLVMRVAWLRVTGRRMFAVDTSGLLSAQLWDLADLLEALDAEERWGQP